MPTVDRLCTYDLLHLPPLSSDRMRPAQRSALWGSVIGKVAGAGWLRRGSPAVAWRNDCRSVRFDRSGAPRGPSGSNFGLAVEAATG
jgi:hypothetical protein